MSKPYVLIDFENVQPKTLDRLQPGSVRIKVFLGQHQNRLMLELVQALQPFGADAEYIAIQGSGPDAVDFHIAFYIGRLAAGDPGATFTIISRDKGCDPLVRHLVGRQRAARVHCAARPRRRNRRRRRRQRPCKRRCRRWPLRRCRRNPPLRNRRRRNRSQRNLPRPRHLPPRRRRRWRRAPRRAWRKWWRA